MAIITKESNEIPGNFNQNVWDQKAIFQKYKQ
jgi:hypothetical protein